MDPKRKVDWILLVAATATELLPGMTGHNLLLLIGWLWWMNRDNKS